MENNENLRTMSDYGDKETRAARMALIDVACLFQHHYVYRIIGGWVPELCYPHQGHVGSTDVDVLLSLDQNKKQKETLNKKFLKNGFSKHPTKSFSYIKEYLVDGTPISVDIDLLGPFYNGTSTEHTTQRIEGIKARKASGGDFAFLFPSTLFSVDSSGHEVEVISVIPYIVMKSFALRGRKKFKDAYDIYFMLKHYPGGVSELKKQFSKFVEKPIIVDTFKILNEHFDSSEGKGPLAIITFYDTDDDENHEIIKQESFQLVQELISK
ncbi:MAG: hypothetical protein NTV44_05830 [Firmicutes bacterium]|nr:hypothetical protein [Bacillota bacterium]